MRVVETSSPERGRGTNDLETRDRLIIGHVGLVKTLASRMAQRLPPQAALSRQSWRNRHIRPHRRSEARHPVGIAKLGNFEITVATDGKNVFKLPDNFGILASTSRRMR